MSWLRYRKDGSRREPLRDQPRRPRRLKAASSRSHRHQSRKYRRSLLVDQPISTRSSGLKSCKTSALFQNQSACLKTECLSISQAITTCLPQLCHAGIFTRSSQVDFVLDEVYIQLRYGKVLTAISCFTMSRTPTGPFRAVLAIRLGFA